MLSRSSAGRRPHGPPRRRSLRRCRSQGVRASTSSSASSRGRETRLSIVGGHAIRNGVRGAGLLHPPVRVARLARVQLPHDDPDSRRSLVHDGRQSWRIRRQQVLGTRSHRSGSSEEPSPPTGRSTGSGSSSPAPSAGEAPRAGRRHLALQAPHAPCEQRTAPVRLRQAARGAADRGRRRGRPRLSGRPARRGGRAVRLQDPRHARAPLAQRPERLQAALLGAREELYPLVLRAAARVVRRLAGACAGIDSRGLHKTNLAALRDAVRGVSSGVSGEVLCLIDGFAVPDFGRPQRAIVDGDATSAAIAAASIVAKVTRDRYMQGADIAPPGLGLWRAHGLLHALPPRGDPPQRRLAAAQDVLPVARIPAARPLTRLPGPLDVIQAHQCAVVGRGSTRDRVKAGRRGPAAGVSPRPAIPTPAARSRARRRGLSQPGSGARRRSDVREHDCAARGVQGDQVDLAAGGRCAAGEDRKPAPLAAARRPGRGRSRRLLVLRRVALGPSAGRYAPLRAPRVRGCARSRVRCVPDRILLAPQEGPGGGPAALPPAGGRRAAFRRAYRARPAPPVQEGTPVPHC